MTEPGSAGRTLESQDGMAHEALGLLSRAMLGLRSTHDLATACAIAGESARTALHAADYRLLRLEPRSGALRCIDPTGEETRYLPEPGGPVEHAMRREQAVFDEGHVVDSLREAALWSERPASIATVPLVSGGSAIGVLLLSFSGPRAFDGATRTLLQTLGDGLTLALERAQLRRELEEEHRAVLALQSRRTNEEEASSNLMSVVAHEIRSHLTSIKAYTEAMLDNLGNHEAPSERFLSIIN